MAGAKRGLKLCCNVEFAFFAVVFKNANFLFDAPGGCNSDSIMGPGVRRGDLSGVDTFAGALRSLQDRSLIPPN